MATSIIQKQKGMGISELLAKSETNDSSGVQHTIKNINLFSCICVVWYEVGVGRYTETRIIPTELFKTVLRSNQMYSARYSAASEFTYFAYDNDTQIALRNAGTNHYTYVYGVY